MPCDDERVDPKLNSDQKSQSDSSHSSESGRNMNTADFTDDKSVNDAQGSDDIFLLRISKRSSKQSVFPRNYNDFVVDSKINAINNEMDALLRNNTWDIIDLPKNRKAIGSKWIFMIKYKSSGEIDRYKARLVAQGFGQKERINYEETFSPVVKMVCELKKSLYGLKQAPRQCNAKLTSTLIENGFSHSNSDYSLYTKSVKGVFLALIIYVDDIIITGNNISEIEKFKVYLKSKFRIKDLGKLKYFLGIEVSDTDKGICPNQRKYVLDLLFEYGMLACKPAKTLLMSKLIISNEATENDHILDNITGYQKLMGKLIYLTNTRPDISYIVHCLSQFMHSPLKSHLKIAFKILRYLKSCPGLGIHIIKNSVESANQIADILTKGLDTLQHKGFVEKVGMLDIYQL
ncbi:ribonuclease H-like domain-containing protein [Tanacetum coccineum]